MHQGFKLKISAAIVLTMLCARNGGKYLYTFQLLVFRERNPQLPST